MRITENFKRRFKRSSEQAMTTGTEEFLKLFLDGDDISVEEALSIPAFASCINLIANLIASLPINLYKEEGDGKTQVVRNDPRVALVNEDTGDLLDAVQFKTALVRDYLLYGAGYAYVNWRGNTCKSIHYVEHSMVNLHTNVQTDPIFKTATLYVGTKQYDPYKFIVIARNTKDGITGKSIVRECSTALRTYHNLLRYEKLLASTGGAKRGVIEAEKQLSDLAMDKLKAAWLKLFKNGEDTMLILNSGAKFRDIGSTSVEMQLDEHKRSATESICQMCGVPPEILGGGTRGATDEAVQTFFRTGIQPILTVIETAFNKSLLLLSERKSMYWAFDAKALLKGDMLKRYQAYAVAIRNHFMQPDEVRYMEDLEPLGLNFVCMGLDTVFYSPQTKDVYTPNTNQTSKINGQTTKIKGETTEDAKKSDST